MGMYQNYLEQKKDKVNSFVVGTHSYIAGDVLKIECANDSEKIVRVEKVLDDGKFAYWDIFAPPTSWEGVPCIVVGEMHPKDVRAVRKVGTIPDHHRDAYVEFTKMYLRLKSWEKDLL